MFGQTRRTFIRLGALAAAGPLVGKWIPVSSPLKAAPAGVAQNAFVTMRARLIPCLSGGLTLGQYAQVVSLGWTDSQRSLRARARIAMHDVLREVMEQVPPTEDISEREPPFSTLAWHAELIYVTWELGGVDRDRLVAVERKVFTALDNDTSVALEGRKYNTALRQSLDALASEWGISVSVSLPAIVRLDRPTSWLWSSSNPALNEPASAGIIAGQLSDKFLPRLEALVRHPDQLLTRSLHRAAAMAKLGTPGLAAPSA
jgi:hypothetical protein